MLDSNRQETTRFYANHDKLDVITRTDSYPLPRVHVQAITPSWRRLRILMNPDAKYIIMYTRTFGQVSKDLILSIGQLAMKVKRKAALRQHREGVRYASSALGQCPARKEQALARPLR